MKSLFLMIAGVVLFIFVVGTFIKTNKANSTTNQVQLKTIKVGDSEVKVTLADTDALKRKGLGGTASLPQDQGMLFTFQGEKAIPSFWMKDMLIPLDMIWIKDGKIVQINKNVPNPPPETPNQNLSIYSPNQIVDYVLEVNAGFSDKNNITVGSGFMVN